MIVCVCFLVLASNKMLAGQLYAEFKEIFSNSHVEYFVSSPIETDEIFCYLVLFNPYFMDCGLDNTKQTR